MHERTHIIASITHTHVSHSCTVNYIFSKIIQNLEVKNLPKFFPNKIFKFEYQSKF